jgi:hypothetical protein
MIARGRIKTLIRCLGMISTVLLLSAVPAKADTILNYQINGTGFSASFSLAQHPVPSALLPFGLGFDIASVPVNVNGAWTSLTLYFYTTPLGGGGVAALNSFALLGPQLFSSSPNTPVMKAQTFTLLGGSASSGGYYTLTVSPVPEPNSLVLLGIGGLVLLGILRRR